MNAPLTKTAWLAFAAALMATMMDLLDSTIATTAGPVMQADLGGSSADLQWISAAYTLALAVTLLTGGRLGDMFGRKRVLLGGTAAFTVASVACALAPTMETLIAFRAVQGATAAVMVPQVFGIIRDIFPPSQIGKAFGILGPVAGLSAVAGPIVSGLVVDLDVLGTGWRAVFLINVPVGAFVLVCGARHIPAVAPSAAGRRLDLMGTLLGAAGMTGVVYPLVQGHEAGWPAWTFAVLGAAVVTLVLFAAQQARRNAKGRAALVETSIFTRRSYVGGLLFASLFMGVMAGMGVVLGVLMQVGLGHSPIEAALTTAPYAVGGFLGAGVGATLSARLGRTTMHIGLAIKAAGLTALVVVLDAAGASLGSWDVVAPLLVAGLGMGMVFVPLFDIVLGGVRDAEVGSASGVLSSVQQLGMALGVAALGTVFFSAAGAGEDLGAMVDATATTILACIGTLAVVFAVGFILPKRGRDEHAPVEGELVPAVA